MWQEDPAECVGDGHHLTAEANPGNSLSKALTDIMDEEASELYQGTTVYLL
jgi:hypothetical protein